MTVAPYFSADGARYSNPTGLGTLFVGNMEYFAYANSATRIAWTKAPTIPLESFRHLHLAPTRTQLGDARFPEYVAKMAALEALTIPYPYLSRLEDSNVVPRLRSLSITYDESCAAFDPRSVRWPEVVAPTLTALYFCSDVLDHIAMRQRTAGARSTSGRDGMDIRTSERSARLHVDRLAVDAELGLDPRRLSTHAGGAIRGRRLRRMSRLPLGPSVIIHCSEQEHPACRGNLARCRADRAVRARALCTTCSPAVQSTRDHHAEGSADRTGPHPAWHGPASSHAAGHARWRHDGAPFASGR